ncbi:hypothetical protein ACFLRC_04905 [Candidatus Altiarchaeota archaeon]
MAIQVTTVGDVNVDVVTSPLAGLPARDSQALLEDLNLTTGRCQLFMVLRVSLLLGAIAIKSLRIGEGLVRGIWKMSRGQ